jgi:hypothetical protein
MSTPDPTLIDTAIMGALGLTSASGPGAMPPGPNTLANRDVAWAVLLSRLTGASIDELRRTTCRDVDFRNDTFDSGREHEFDAQARSILVHLVDGKTPRSPLVTIAEAEFNRRWGELVNKLPEAQRDVRPEHALAAWAVRGPRLAIVLSKGAPL